MTECTEWRTIPSETLFPLTRDIALNLYPHDTPTVFYDLTPDTAPAAIWQAQVDAVREAHSLLGTLDIATLSRRCDLPHWNITRALAELKLIKSKSLPTQTTLMRKGRKRSERVLAYLTKLNRLATVQQIAKALNMSRPHVRQCLIYDGAPFQPHRLPKKNGRTRVGWQLRGWSPKSAGKLQAAAAS